MAPAMMPEPVNTMIDHLDHLSDVHLARLLVAITVRIGERVDMAVSFGDIAMDHEAAAGLDRLAVAAMNGMSKH